MNAVLDFLFFFGGCLLAKDIWALSISINIRLLSIVNYLNRGLHYAQTLINWLILKIFLYQSNFQKYFGLSFVRSKITESNFKRHRLTCSVDLTIFLKFQQNRRHETNTNLITAKGGAGAGEVETPSASAPSHSTQRIKTKSNRV